MPGEGRNAYVRVDWQRPAQETLAVADGKYTLFRPRLKHGLSGHARTRRTTR